MADLTPSPSFGAFYETFVGPFYLGLLGGLNRASESERAPFRSPLLDGSFRQALLSAAQGISDDQLRFLLDNREWRGRMCAAWFIGMTGRASFVRPLGELLIRSELVYAGAGYCLALALIATEDCEHILREYLRIYLPLKGRFYDQDWAIGALALLQGKLPAEFLDAQLWRDGNHSMDPARGVETVAETVAYLRRHDMVSSRQ